MNDVEKRLRDALGAAAETVDENHRRALPAAPPRRLRWHGWLIPLCGAASVIMIAAVFVGLRMLGRQPRTLEHLQPMPRLYVSSTLPDGRKPSRLEVRDSRTGRLLDAREAGRGMVFRSVAAIGDGRVFLASYEREGETDCRPRIYRVSVSVLGRITGMVTVVSNARIGRDRSVSSLAVSPDGTRIAFVVTSCAGPSGRQDEVAVMDLPNGRLRSWSGGPSDVLDSLSLAARGRYLFVVRRNVNLDVSREVLREGTFRIDLSTSNGGDVAGAGHLVRPIGRGDEVMWAVSGSDGEHLIVLVGTLAVAHTGWSRASAEPVGPSTAAPEQVKLDEVSVADGRSLRVIRFSGMPNAAEQWLKVDASGRYVTTRAGVVDLLTGRPAAVTLGVASTFDVAW